MKIIFFMLLILLLTGNEVISQTTINKKPQVIIFLSAKCPCVYSHKDSFKSLIKNYENQVDFLAVFIGKYGDSEDIHDMLKNLNWGIKYVVDTKNKYIKEYTPKVFTDVVLIDSLNHVIYRGSIDDGVLNSGQIIKFYLKDAIEEYLSKQPIKVKEGKGVGCLIIS
jgi:hypothetical protein